MFPFLKLLLKTEIYTYNCNAYMYITHIIPSQRALQSLLLHLFQSFRKLIFKNLHFFRSLKFLGNTHAPSPKKLHIFSLLFWSLTSSLCCLLQQNILGWSLLIPQHRDTDVYSTHVRTLARTHARHPHHEQVPALNSSVVRICLHNFYPFPFSSMECWVWWGRKMEKSMNTCIINFFPVIFIQTKKE